MPSEIIIAKRCLIYKQSQMAGESIFKNNERSNTDKQRKYLVLLYWECYDVNYSNL